jgi:hypothetical protein
LIFYNSFAGKSSLPDGLNIRKRKGDVEGDQVSGTGGKNVILILFTFVLTLERPFQCFYYRSSEIERQ